MARSNSDLRSELTRPASQALRTRAPLRQRDLLGGARVEPGADEALDLELVEEGGVTAPPIEETCPRVVQAGVDPRIDLEPIDELAAITL